MRTATDTKPLRICLVGATGLVGSRLIAQAVGRSDVRLIGVARREATLPFGARMEMLVADPESWADAIAAANASVLVCALGTTRRKVGGGEAAFRAIDLDLALACGKAAKAARIQHMIAVSSVGADLASRSLYLQVKGEMEHGLGRVGFKRLDILRPGLIRGPRGESRPAERIAAVLSPAADLLLHGSLRKFRSVDADVLARVILALAGERAGGRFVHEHDSMIRALRRSRG